VLACSLFMVQRGVSMNRGSNSRGDASLAPVKSSLRLLSRLKVL
jgi:hypothetical protein